MSQSKTIIEHFYDQESNNPNAPFLHQPFGENWETYTRKEAGMMARKLCSYLKAQNLPPKSHIGLVSKNCREWLITDLAIMMAGHVSVPFFATLSGEQINTVLKLGDVVMLFVGKTEVWDDMKTGVPEDMPIVKFPHYQGNSKVERGTSWHSIMSDYKPDMDTHKPKMTDLWTIIFTSGTTGTPKGVMHSYKSINAVIEEAFRVNNPLGLSEKGDNRFFSFLPLNHIAERALVACLPHKYGGEIFFTESLEQFGKNLNDAQPTTFFAVPRIWTKFMLKILEKMPQKKLNTLLKIPIVSSLVKKKITKGLGLQNARCTAVGAAPIAQSTKDWFKALGIGITEGYGMTENCAATSFLLPDQDRPGSVGLPLNGVEIKLAPETNEILMKGNVVMEGYYKDPEKTAETIVDGWLHTGDQGRFDEDGFLYITGRVKDTFKTAKAKFIVPSEVEAKFCDCMDIEQLCLLGLGMPQPVLFVALSDLGKAKTSEDIKESLTKELDKVNSKLPSYKKVSTIVVVKEAFSIEDDTLTPTLKIKRPQIHNKYKSDLLNYCETADKVVWEL